MAESALFLINYSVIYGVSLAAFGFSIVGIGEETSDEWIVFLSFYG